LGKNLSRNFFTQALGTFLKSAQNSGFFDTPYDLLKKIFLLLLGADVPFLEDKR
jgi:hypothetical protein